jgi:hypothetical protein
MLKHYLNEYYPYLRTIGGSKADYEALYEVIKQS